MQDCRFGGDEKACEHAQEWWEGFFVFVFVHTDITEEKSSESKSDQAKLFFFFVEEEVWEAFQKGLSHRLRDRTRQRSLTKVFQR